MSFPAGPVSQYTNRRGFGTLRDPTYFVMPPEIDTPQGKMMIFGAATATLRGSGVIVPYWSIILPLAALHLACSMGWIRRMKPADAVQTLDAAPQASYTHERSGVSPTQP